MKIGRILISVPLVGSVCWAIGNILAQIRLATLILAPEIVLVNIFDWTFPALLVSTVASLGLAYLWRD